MGMVFCRGCGKDIHDSAPICPHCGAPQHSLTHAKPGGGISTGLLVGGYAGAVLFPIVGVVIGIIALVKGAVGHGIAMLGISLLWVVAALAAA